MNTPPNKFKQALREPRAQIGLWLGLADSYSAEICAGAGFDWLLIDGEHSPNGLRSILGQAQAIAAGGTSHAIARVPVGDAVLIKQYLDIGIRTLLVPMVDTAEQARELVRATRYPPEGIRGMAGARASRWGRYADYQRAANDQICLLLQIESMTGLEQLEAIASVEGVDGVFIGPADLSASMGWPGKPSQPEVQAAIEGALKRIAACGKAPGILTPDEALAKHYIELGARFVAVGLDTGLLVRGLAALAGKFGLEAPQVAGGTGYA